jgi:hypothetical protein
VEDEEGDDALSIATSAPPVPSFASRPQQLSRLGSAKVRFIGRERTERGGGMQRRKRTGGRNRGDIQETNTKSTQAQAKEHTQKDTHNAHA